MTHCSTGILIALQSQDHHKQEDKNSKSRNTSHRHKSQAGENTELQFAVVVPLKGHILGLFFYFFFFCIISGFYLKPQCYVYAVPCKIIPG